MMVSTLNYILVTGPNDNIIGRITLEQCTRISIVRRQRRRGKLFGFGDHAWTIVRVRPEGEPRTTPYLGVLLVSIFRRYARM